MLSPSLHLTTSCIQPSHFRVTSIKPVATNIAPAMQSSDKEDKSKGNEHIRLTSRSVSSQSTISAVAKKAGRSSLLKSMEMICVAPIVPADSPLQRSFLGNIYRDTGVSAGGDRNKREH